MRFLRLLAPDTPFDRLVIGRAPVVVGEGPRGAFAEIRGATLQEVGLWCRKALPPARTEEA